MEMFILGDDKTQKKVQNTIKLLKVVDVTTLGVVKIAL